jgi:hypothetical protein
VRHAWSALMTNEGSPDQAEETERDDEDEDADA